MTFRSDAANEATFSWSYDEMVAHIMKGEKADVFVPLSTYADYDSNVLIGCWRYWRSIGVYEGDIPVPMKGSRRMRIGEPYIRYKERLLDRFIRLNRLTVIELSDEISVMKKASKSLKRISGNNPSSLFTRIDGGVWGYYRGVKGFFTQDKLSVMKSIDRQIGKLEKIIGKKDNQKWQRLIQQAI